MFCHHFTHLSIGLSSFGLVSKVQRVGVIDLPLCVTYLCIGVLSDCVKNNTLIFSGLRNDNNIF